ncbi:MAG: diaminopimelate epimerase [Alphaproteobacteria bacterium]|nr:MAG: diaminopimelate epimerase [Alphaproteobacteria bacterium]
MEKCNKKLHHETVAFIKAQGLGNDFVMIDIDGLSEYDWSKFAKQMSNRRLGIGFDQLLLFKKSKVWFYNSDGTEAETCGNGTRCLAYYLMSKNNCTSIEIETPGGTVFCSLNSDRTVSVQMTKPTVVEERSIVAHADLFKYPPVFVRIGNPHLVCFVEHLDDIHEYGPILSRQDVNVEFVNVLNEHQLRLKVWERGAGLTPACGSGACASVIAAQHHKLVESNVEVFQDGGKLDISWNGTELYMRGACQIVYEGQLSGQFFSSFCQVE